MFSSRLMIDEERQFEVLPIQRIGQIVGILKDT